jgi:class 3 adenylate cyclase
MTGENPTVRMTSASDGTSLAYTVSGEGDPALIFVRGWVSHLELMWANPQFRAFFRPFAESFRLVRYDGRGNGLSQRDINPRVELDDLVDDLDSIVRATAHGPVVLFGQTFGGPIAIQYAAQHPERVTKLILDTTFANGTRLTPGPAGKSLKALIPFLRQMPEAAFQLLGYLTNPRGDVEQQARMDFARRSITPKAAFALYSLAWRINIQHLLSEIVTPTLVIHRSEAQAVPIELGRQLAAGIRGASFVEVGGASANPWDDDPATVLGAIAAFLGSHLPPYESPIVRARRTATILFTDIESHSSTLSPLGDERGREVLREHERRVRGALGHHNGLELKTMGDGFMASFTSAQDALECAIALQRAFLAPVNGVPLRIRIGINAGEPISEEEDLFGASVIVAARVAAEARGGQVLAANVVRELAAGSQFRFIDAGERQLRGFDEPLHVWELKLD